MDIKRIATRVVAVVMTAAIATVTILPARPAEAVASKAEQILFLKEIYLPAQELGKEYGIPWQAGVITACAESQYGTSEFARRYNNLTGYACPRTGVCNKAYSSKEECLEDYFRLLADSYGLRGCYGDPMAAITAAVVDHNYNPNPSIYLEFVGSVYRDVKRLDAEVNASIAADIELIEEAEAARMEQMMAELADETVYVIDAKAKSAPAVAGATAAMFPAMKEMTVGQAAQKIIKGKLSSSRDVLGNSYADVHKYVEYVTLPTGAGV